MEPGIPADFQAFCFTDSSIKILSDISPATSTSASPPVRVSDPVADFKKGIKRDSSLYPTLKDQKHWNNWNRSVIAQAHAHDISEVFDTNYIPSNEVEANLFQQKQIFAYSVLNKCVMTDQGKSYVREHESDFDAQSVY